MIGNKIIEVHLRMGDLNYFQSKLLTQKVISHYQGIYRPLPKISKIYLVPVFANKGNYKRVDEKDLISIARYYDNASFHTRYYQIDPCDNGNPIGGDRICNLIVTDLEIGLKIRDMILKKYYGRCCRRWYIGFLISDIF